jgi:hypothetical protein
VAYRIGDDDISVQILLYLPDEVGSLLTSFE